MPMNLRLLRPIASGVHPEANAWRTAVVANGGSVSASTMRAVSKFCGDIDKANIRDRFYRLNLFCGNSDASVVAPRVPLYRGPSRTGTQYGNALDANNNFVQGDYVETGASGGLTSNGTSKYLNTGFKADALTQTDRHMSMVGVTTSSITSEYFLGMDNFGCGSNAFWGILTGGTNSAQIMVRAQAAASNSTAFAAGAGYVMLSGNGSPQAYVDGAVGITGLAGAYTAPNLDVYVHALNRCNVPDFTSAKIKSYSLGAAMTAGQVTSFYNAILAFNTSLSRA